MKIRYIGSGTNPASYQEYPVTGVNALWQPEQVSDVSDARANALVATGGFVFDDESGAWSQQIKSRLSDSSAAGIYGLGPIPDVQAISTADHALQPINSNLLEVVPPNPYPSQSAAPVHPALLYFKAGLWGYRYWMAYTPYPGSDSQYENPCVAASNDLQTWVSPAANPLVQKPAGASNYNADPHIFMAPDNSRMYLAFRERIIGGNNNVKVMHTSDGVNWSAPVTIISGAQGSVDYGSPSIWWNGTGWTMISHQIDAAAPWPVRRNVSSTSDVYGAWGAATTVTIAAYSSRAWWHSFHVRMPSGQVIALFQDNNQSAGAAGALYMAESADDGATYSITGPVWAATSKYRSAFAVRMDSSGPVIDFVLGDLSVSKLYYFASRSNARAVRAAGLSRHSSALLAPTNLQQGVLWADTCTRADSAVSPGTADSGGSYTVSSGTWGIGTNRLYPVATGRLLASAGTANHAFSVQFVDITTATQQWAICRSVDASNYWRAGVLSPSAAGASPVVLQNIVSGAVGAVNKIVGSIARGDVLTVEGIGGLVRVYVNGVPIHEEPCITSATGTSFGIQANAGANTFFRNLTCIRSDQ